jgi:hypothetical protein
MNENRHTITLNRLAFSRLKEIGRFAETYSDLILRLVDYYKSTTNYDGGKKF